jgi:hypothetical protein
LNPIALPALPPNQPWYVYVLIVAINVGVPAFITWHGRKPATTAVSVPPLEPSTALIELVHKLEGIGGLAPQLAELRDLVRREVERLEAHLLSQDQRLGTLESQTGLAVEKARDASHNARDVLQALPGVAIATAERVATTAAQVAEQLKEDHQ